MENWQIMEQAGYGKGPYKCLDYYKSTFQATSDGPVRPGASCDRCGQDIMHVYEIQSADGHLFKVGMDCVLRFFGKATAKLARDTRRAYERKAEREARQAKERVENAALGLGAKTSEELYAERKAAERQARENELARREAEKAARRERSQHQFAVGERVDLVLTLRFKTVFDTMFGVQNFYDFDDANGNAIVVKPSGGLSYTDTDGQWKFLEAGQTFRVRGTVKSHGEYLGLKQTRLARVKVVGRVVG